jgi:DNA-binding response OmpR family regulator
VAVKTLRAAKERLGRERFDAIVLDLSLPDGSGLELLELLEQGPAHNAPVVIFSAQDAGAAVAQQVQAALTKSRASIDELVATIKMHARQYRDEGQHGGKAS